MEQTHRLGAVVSAAGRSSRMGDFKPLLPVGGLPLLETAIRALQAGGAEQIWVVTGHRAAELRPLLERTGAREVYNPAYADADLFASVRLGLRAAAGCGRILFLPGDVALFRPHTVRTMAARQADLVLPRCRGETGHPVLLGAACAGYVLDYGGPGGLRGALAHVPGRREILDVPDPGILLDADTPGDYRALLDYAAGRAVPDRAGCLEILAWYGTPAGVIAHCEAVADTALALCAAVNRAGGRLDPRLVQAGALLHDVAKGAPYHDRAGEALLRELDCPAVAALVGAHMALPPGGEDLLDERALVYYADKVTQGTRRVTLEERFARSGRRFGDDPAALAAAGERRRSALRVERNLRALGLV